MFLTTLLLSSLLAQSTSPLPPFPQRNLLEELGQCSAQMIETQQWAQLLIDEIKKRDMEIAKLKMEIEHKGE